MIFEQEMSPLNRVNTGQYYYDYVPEAIGTINYEWHGRIEGQPSLYRASLSPGFSIRGRE